MGWGLAFKIAWRNLWRHRGKSLVIGGILFFGAVLMTIGNGMISGMERGLSENIINSFTGDIVVISDTEEKDDVLFSFSGKPLKVMKDFQAIKKVMAKETIIQKYLPATAGMVNVFNAGSEFGYIYLLGIDIERYRRMFPGSIKITEGRLLKPGEHGVLVSEEARKMGYDSMDFWLLPEGGKLDIHKLPADARQNLNSLDIRRDLVFMGASTSNSAVDIRVPVTGIMTYKALNKIWGSYCIVDIESFRQAHNYVTGDDTKVVISGQQKQLLESDNPDQMFGGGDMVENVTATDSNFSMQKLQQQTRREVTKYNPDAGSYNLIFIKLKKGVDQQQAIGELNRIFRENHLGIRAVSWKNAVGAYGSMAVMIKGSLNLFIMFIFFVAIIVIMNTLSMTALERVSELGMMRAIGARKGFLRRMFVSETGTLSFFFGGLGIIVGIILIYLIKAAGISTTNEILQLVYGGDKLNPIFTIWDLLLGVMELAIVTLLAVLYPLKVVGGISPLDAITRD